MTFPVESKLPDEWEIGDTTTDRGTVWTYHGEGIWKATNRELEIRYNFQRDVGEFFIEGEYRCTLTSRRISTMIYETRKVLPE